MSDYLPLEVTVKILERLPVKSLVRFMCVCKAWKSLITNDGFIKSHHQHLQSNPANSSLFIHLRTEDDVVDNDADAVDGSDDCFYGGLSDNDDDDYDGDDAISTELKGDLYSLYSNDNNATNSLSVLKFPPFKISHASDPWIVVGTCNGLVCFGESSLEYENYAQAAIWNPNILKYRILPKCSIPRRTHGSYHIFYGFGYDSQNNDFKLVRFVYCFYTETMSQVEIYSLVSHSWRSIIVAPFGFRIARLRNQFVNGVLHWLAYRTINGMKHYFILTFDLVEEKFGQMILPQEAQAVWGIFKAGNLLALNSVSPSKHCSIWVMKEYGVVESWTQLFYFDSTSYGNMQDVLGLRNNEELVIKSSDYEIAFLDPIKGSVKKIEQNFGRILFMGDHVGSLFLINEKKNRKEANFLEYFDI